MSLQRDDEMSNNRKSLRRIILEIVALADAMRREAETLARRSKTSGGPKSTDAEYFKALPPARDALVRNLSDLSQEQLAQVAAVLYAGQGSLDNTGYPNMAEGVRRMNNESDLVLLVVAKYPLTLYLREGMRVYNI
jgi:hypothetical protein